MSLFFSGKAKRNTNHKFLQKLWSPLSNFKFNQPLVQQANPSLTQKPLSWRFGIYCSNKSFTSASAKLFPSEGINLKPSQAGAQKESPGCAPSWLLPVLRNTFAQVTYCSTFSVLLKSNIFSFVAMVSGEPLILKFYLFEAPQFLDLNLQTSTEISLS